MQIPGYKILKKVGEGATSEVFKAKNPENKEVALKVIRSILVPESGYQERMEKEAMILKTLEDDRIVKILGVEKTDDGRYAIVQEFVEGENLERLCRERGEEPLSILGPAIVSEILLGLEEAHRQGIIHRDLKPENVMVTPKGRVKILDFGVSKSLEQSSLTMTGALMGSPAYMSPEQIEGKLVDQRADLFSLGILLYKLCTGKLPFSSDQYAGLIKSIVDGRYIPPQKINPCLHPNLVKIIQKSLRKESSARYQRAYEFRYELMRYLDSFELPSTPKLLTRFYAGENEIEFGLREKILTTLVARVDHSLKKGEKKEAAKYVQQAMAIDPAATETQEMMRKKAPRKNSYALFLLLLLSFMGFAFWKQSKRVHQTKRNVDEVRTTQAAIKPLPTTTAIEKREVLPVLEKAKATAKPRVVKKEVKPTPRPRVRIRPTAVPTPQKLTRGTFIKFNVDPGVKVFLDDQDVTSMLGEPIPLNPGRHRLRMVKRGFDPIASYVDIPKDQVTVINAKSGGAR